MDGSSSLRNLTKTQINKAFERTRDEASLQEGKLVLITEEMYDAVIEFGIENFAMFEPISCALGCTRNARVDWEILWKSTLGMGLSLALLDKSTGEILGMRLTRRESLDDIFDANNFENDAFKTLLDYCTCADEKAQFSKRFNTKEWMHYLGLAVDKRYRGQGLASKLFAVSIKFAQYLAVHPLYIKGEGSSNYSKKIYEKNGFEILYDSLYNEYVVDGVAPINNTGEHKSMKVYGLKVNS